MTRNQIDYWRLSEETRHNKVGEKETNRANVARETETSRHNRVSESVDIGNLNENIRSHKANELETHRSNVARETETNRHNVATEEETNRHNIVSERIDISKLGETKRHNVATEGLSQANVNLGYASLDEQQRHNEAQERINEVSAVYQNNLNAARTALTQSQADWNSAVQADEMLSRSSARKQIDAYINKLLKEAERTQQTMDWNTYDKVMDGLNTVANLMRSLDDFQRGLQGFTGSESQKQKRYDQYLDSLLEDIRNEN